MSLIIDDKKFINLKFHYIEQPGAYVSKFKFIRNQEEFEKYKEDPNLKELNTSWKVLSWAEHNDIYSQCIQYKTSEEGISLQNLDFIKFRDMKLKMCLKNWDLKDDAGQSVTISSKVIDRLNPQVANELLNGFDRVTETGEVL